MGVCLLTRRRRSLLPAALFALPAFFMLGCAQAPTAPGSNAATAGARGTNPAGAKPESPGGLYSLFHRALNAPEGKTVVLRLHGRGAQIFRCEMQTDGARWVFRLPEAELVDDSGALVVRHGANWSFEHLDGSRLVSEIVDHVPAPDGNALQWLLFSTRSYGSGALTGVSHVQRIQTSGGMPPPVCDAAQVNQVLRVPFSAEFLFLR